MKYSFLLTFVALLLAFGGLAQTPNGDSANHMVRDSAAVKKDSAAVARIANANADNDDFPPPALFVVFMILVGIAAGAAIIGSAIAVVILGGLTLMATAGVLSAGALVGLYRRSMSAAFKTVLLLGGGLAGIVIGSGGFYLVNRYCHLHFATRMALLSGAGGGLLGGLLLGLLVYALARVVLKLLKERLAF